MDVRNVSNMTNLWMSTQIRASLFYIQSIINLKKQDVVPWVEVLHTKPQVQSSLPETHTREGEKGLSPALLRPPHAAHVCLHTANQSINVIFFKLKKKKQDVSFKPILSKAHECVYRTTAGGRIFGHSFFSYTSSFSPTLKSGKINLFKRKKKTDRCLTECHVSVFFQITHQLWKSQQTVEPIQRRNLSPWDSDLFTLENK